MAETRPELLDAAVAVRLIRTQLDMRAATAPHTHVGGCMSMLCVPTAAGSFAGYEPADCDCDGPAMMMATVEFGRKVVEAWRGATWDQREPMVPTVMWLLESLKPQREVCWRCLGNGSDGEGSKKACRTCAGAGTKVRTDAKENADGPGRKAAGDASRPDGQMDRVGRADSPAGGAVAGPEAAAAAEAGAVA